MANHNEPIFNPITKSLDNANENEIYSNNFERQSSNSCSKSKSQIGNEAPSKKANRVKGDNCLTKQR